jgi:hypothetical protein
MIPLNERKLGAILLPADPNNLRLEAYLDLGALPPIPAMHDQGTAVKQPWGMALNDHLGCCTAAAKKHLVQAWTACCGREVDLPDAAVLKAYELDGGYNPADPNSDHGADLLTCLKNWRAVGIGGHKIDAYAQVGPSSHAHVRAGVYLFGGLYIGLAMPAAWQKPGAWDIGKGAAFAAGSWGGHCVPVVAYSSAGLVVITWGARQTLTWAALKKYGQGVYAPLASMDWIANNLSPEGFALSALQADLKAVTG